MAAPSRTRPYSKYHARPTTIDGERFASQREALEYQTLRLREHAGEIRDLILHPSWDLKVPCADPKHPVVKIGKYTSDFQYTEVATGATIICEVKSQATARDPAYRLRKRLFETLHWPLTVTEVF